MRIWNCVSIVRPILFHRKLTHFRIIKYRNWVDACFFLSRVALVKFCNARKKKYIFISHQHFMLELVLGVERVWWCENEDMMVFFTMVIVHVTDWFTAMRFGAQFINRFSGCGLPHATYACACTFFSPFFAVDFSHRMAFLWYSSAL